MALISKKNIVYLSLKLDYVLDNSGDFKFIWVFTVFRSTRRGFLRPADVS